jgi:NADH:ubiquinone oxidoreductase subunit F (NADH-binding)
MGKPTVVNNVETFANVPIILRNGPDWYKTISESKFSGTKIYAIFGQVAKPRVFEAPFGLTLSEMINDFGGGMQPGVDFGFGLVGGAAGRFVPPDLLDLPLDYSSGEMGAHIGVGAALVCGTGVSPVMLLRELMVFFERESCGKCTPCRVGTHKARQILDKIIAGKATAQSIDQLLYLSSIMGSASFCGLGVSVPWPVNSAIKNFKEDFESYFT